MVEIIEDPCEQVPWRTGVSLHACLLRPASRGTVRLANADPTAPPLVDPRHLTGTGVLDGMVRAAFGSPRKFCHPTFQKLGTTAPGSMRRTDDAAIISSIRRRADTIYYPVGTCRMGTDDKAVVDPPLRVRGATGLHRGRVDHADAGQWQGASANGDVGERAANLISGSH